MMRSLPSGWVATSVDYLPGDRPAFGVGMLTADGKFVGMRQQDIDRCVSAVPVSLAH